MKKLIITLLLLLFNFTTFVYAQTPPYSGTIFIDPDIIVASDPSSFQSITYKGNGNRTVFDRRENAWITINAFLFNIVWNDGLTTEGVINPEFGTVENAQIEARKYGFLVGQLPYSLRTDVDQIWVHKGVQPFGGGNNSILIHTGQTELYENDGILEETLVHEAAHTSLDSYHSESAGWVAAQNTDINFISTYARDNKTREDVAESFLPWLMVRYKKSNISTTNFNKITQTIPNRLIYFDRLNLNLYPFFGSNILSNESINDEKSVVSIYPNTTSSQIEILGLEYPSNYEIFNILGASITKGNYESGEKIEVASFPSNIYFLKLENGIVLKFIKK